MHRFFNHTSQRFLLVFLLSLSTQSFEQSTWGQTGESSSPVPSQNSPTEASQSPAPQIALAANGPVVAGRDLKLTKKDGETLDTIQVGDLLTVLEKRDNQVVIQTFRGHKGIVSENHVVPLAESVPVYDKLIAVQPDDGRLYTLRAGAHWAAGTTEKALADFDQAIEMGYQEPLAYTSRGLFHAESGNHDLAIEDYSRAIETDAKDMVPVANRASAYMAKGEYQRAIDDYSHAIKQAPTAPLYTQRALAYKLLGDSQRAIDDYSDALQLFPQDAAALLARGYLQFQLKKHEEAIADFSRLIELTPGSAVAFNNRGFNYQQLKQFDKALADYQRAIELAPRYLLALQNRGWLLTICENEGLRDPGKAIETAEVVCELTEYKEVGALVLLAAAHASAEEFEKAIGWQEKAIELAPEEMRESLKKILARYQDKLPLDPQLLEDAPAT